nr:hypothetical protein [Tanacetum cinerariifolium]
SASRGAVVGVARDRRPHCVARDTQNNHHRHHHRPAVPGRRGRAVGQADADAGADAGRHVHIGAHRRAAGHSFGSQQSLALSADAAARHHADHAQLRVPDSGADAVRSGQGSGDLRHRDLRRTAADSSDRSGD